LVELVDGTRLKIASLKSVIEGWSGTVVGLDDVVFATKEAARQFAMRLEGEWDFFVVPYHDE
jgi:hypothetical protein